MMAVERNPALGDTPDILLQPYSLVAPHWSLSSGLHNFAPAASCHLFLLDKLCLSVQVLAQSLTCCDPSQQPPPKSSWAMLLRCSPYMCVLPSRWRPWEDHLLVTTMSLALREPGSDTQEQGGKRKEQVTHCRWHSPSLALSPVTGLGRPALPGPGRAVAEGAGPGLAPAHPRAASDPALRPGAASAPPLSGAGEDRLVTNGEASRLVTFFPAPTNIPKMVGR